MLGFMTPPHLRKGYFDDCGLGETAEPWDEDKTKMRNGHIVLDGRTFKPRRLFPDQPVTSPKKPDTHLVSPCGQFAYANNRIPAKTPIACWQGDRRGHVWFTTAVISPCLRKTEKWPCDDHYPVWMAYTPAEVFTQRQGVRRATGTVLIAGLGLGWLIRKVAEKKSVKKIILVEKSEGLMQWYGCRLVDEIFRETGTPIEIIVDDAWNHLGKHGSDTRYLFDIWSSYPVFLSQEQRKLVRGVRYFWGWGVGVDS